jgi:biotin transport system ATP-binding protein
MNAEICLEVLNVAKKFPDGTVALDDVSFKIFCGDFVVLAGSNGSGKSVLMSLIAGLDEATSGEIKFSGRAGLVFQDADAQILGETPSEDVSFGARNLGLRGEKLFHRVDECLESAGLLHKKNSYSRTLSGGEKRRLAVAGILAINPALMIFDEPFANLDWPGVRTVCALLKKLKDEKKTVIVLTHELEKILALANRFIVLDKGKIRFDGTPDDGLKKNLEAWSIRNPLTEKNSAEELLWL